MPKANEGTHITHCCAKHGCKYQDPTCPVVLGTKLQAYPCEDCEEEEEQNNEPYYEAYRLISRIGYMDKVDFDEELGNALDGNKIYPSLESLLKYKRCATKCGAVRVRVIFEEVVIPAVPIKEQLKERLLEQRNKKLENGGKGTDVADEPEAGRPSG